ncbi:response regulator [Pseudoalteromonas fenneropenaei]|uniref:Response regulator n=1 Tax=Pseudoalteromonas fenneropenaei TaxID=1737459 RepID=A0ABV7CG75_9GAMM
MNHKLKVHLVDDQALFRQGLQALLALSQSLVVSGSASDGKAFLQQLQSNTVDADVILLDMRMPELSGAEVLEQMQLQNLMRPCVILTTFDDTQQLRRAMQAGAKGCLLKDIALEALENALHQVCRGEVVIQPTLASSLFNQHTLPLLEQLTEREREILALIAHGKSNKEIAALLFKAEGTVRNQVSNVLAKLQVRDRTQATLRAYELGLVK